MDIYGSMVLQQYVNHELPDVQAGFRKAEEPEIKLPTSTGSSKKASHCLWILLGCENINHLTITLNPMGGCVSVCVFRVLRYKVTSLGTFLVKNLLKHREIWPL